MATLVHVDYGGEFWNAYAPSMPVSAGAGETAILVVGSYVDGGGDPAWTPPEGWSSVIPAGHVVVPGGWDWYAFKFDGDATMLDTVTVGRSGMGVDDNGVLLLMRVILAPGEAVTGAASSYVAGGESMVEVTVSASQAAAGSRAAFILGWKSGLG